LGRVAFVALLTIFAAISIAATLSYNGFCLSRFRFLSDDEAIDAAIDEVLHPAIHIIETPTGGYAQFEPKRQIGYRNRPTFRRINPDCCKIVPHDRQAVGYGHQLFGMAAKSVFIRYTVRYIGDDGRQLTQEAVAQRAVSNCGHVKH